MGVPIRRARSLRIAFTVVAAFVVVAATACTPRDAVAIRVFTRGGDDALQWTFRDGRGGEQWGVVTPGPEMTCITVGRGWRVDIATVNQVGDAERHEANASSSDFSWSQPLNLAIERDDDGRVAIREAVPDWWPIAPPQCVVTFPDDAR